MTSEQKSWNKGSYCIRLKLRVSIITVINVLRQSVNNLLLKGPMFKSFKILTSPRLYSFPYKECFTHTHTHTHSLSLSLSHTHTHSLSLTHTHSLSLSLTHTHTLSLSLSLSHTHTHTVYSSDYVWTPSKVSHAWFKCFIARGNSKAKNTFSCPYILCCIKN